MRLLCAVVVGFAMDPGVATASACPPVLEMRFVEGAPVDRFEIVNVSGADIDVQAVTLDLRHSKGRLVFDTAPGGLGVQVYQPFRSEAGVAIVADGAETLHLDLAGLRAGAQASFTIDVDDRLTASQLGQIRVSGSEIEGATVDFQIGVDRVQAIFAADSVARWSGCEEGLS